MCNKPTVIVITPVRNEAWVLDAFLTCTSSWADYIILADQHSDDGTREIASRYEKVVLIDNPTQEWYEYLCRTRLLEEAAKLPGDNKLIFGLDADEFLSEGFEKTESWNRMMSSQGTQVFCFKWLNLYDDFYSVEFTDTYSDWAGHFDKSVDFVEEYKKRENHAVHCARIPCLETNRCQYFVVDDFWVIHLAKLNHDRTCLKNIFYQVTWVDKNKEKANPIGMYRGSSKFYPESLSRLDSPIKLCCKGDSKDYSFLIKDSDYGKHYIKEMLQVFERAGTDKFAKLCIWDNPYLIEAGIKPKIPLKYRILHGYLRKSQSKAETKAIKLIDKILKRLYRF